MVLASIVIDTAPIESSKLSTDEIDESTAIFEIATVYFVIYYIGNKKNSFAAKQILNELVQSLCQLKFSDNSSVYENLSSIPLGKRRLYSIRSIKCRSKWYRMVAAVDVVYNNNSFNNVLGFLREVNNKLLDKEPFSIIHLDTDADIFARISEKKDYKDIVTAIRNTETVKSFFRNEFYILEHLNRSFRNLKRFSRVDKLNLVLYSVTNSSPRLILSLDYNKSDCILDIRLSFKKTVLERQLTVKSFSINKIFEPVIFNQIIDLILEEIQKTELVNHSFTSYKLSFIRSFGNRNHRNYIGTISSDNNSLFLRMTDFILFNRTVYSLLGNVQDYLAEYYIRNKRRILDTQRQRIVKGKKSGEILKYSVEELQSINIWNMADSSNSVGGDSDRFTVIPLLTSEELLFLDRIKRITMYAPSQSLISLSFVELNTLVDLARKNLLKIYFKKEIYDGLVKGINTRYILKKENYKVKMTKKGIGLILSLQTTN